MTKFPPTGLTLSNLPYKIINYLPLVALVTLEGDTDPTVITYSDDGTPADQSWARELSLSPPGPIQVALWAKIAADPPYVRGLYNSKADARALITPEIIAVVQINLSVTPGDGLDD